MKNQAEGIDAREIAELEAFLLTDGVLGSSKFTRYEIQIAYLISRKTTQTAVLRWLAAEPRNVTAARSELSRWLSLSVKREAKAEKKAAIAKKANQAGTNRLFDGQDGKYQPNAYQQASAASSLPSPTQNRREHDERNSGKAALEERMTTVKNEIAAQNASHLAMTVGN